MNGELSIFSSNKGFAIWTELDTKVSEVIVFSTMGELVFRENIEIQKGAVTNVTSPDFSAGTYVVKIRNENEVYTSQIVLY